MIDFEDIYYILIGEREAEDEFSWVESINTKGSTYARACRDLEEAYARLCGRMGIDTSWDAADEDVAAILDSMDTMQREVAWGMFDCGMKYRKRNFNCKQ